MSKKSFSNGPRGSHSWIYGFHASKALLDNPLRRIHRVVMTPRLYASWERPLPSFNIEQMDPDRLAALLPPQAVHQGIAILADPLEETYLEDILRAHPDEALLLMLDHVTDPQNFGALIRSAVAFGVKGLITTHLHAPPLSGLVAKVASGALEHLPIITVSNLANAIRQLKDAGFWCYGLDERGISLRESDTSEPKRVLIVGAEGEGLRSLTKNLCDGLLSIPTASHFSTLNVANATAVALYALTPSGSPHDPS